MSMDANPMSADSLVERRRLRRSRSFWRVASILLLVLGVAAFIANATGIADQITGRGEHIARVQLDGFINLDDPFLKLLEELGEDEDVQGVVLRINSPGGVAVAGEAIYAALRDLNETKPIVAVIDGLGTSAAYLAASASEHIVARNGSIVGSIGVLMQFPDVSGLLEHIGVTMHEVRSGDLKAQPSVFAPPSEDALEALNQLISDNFDWFVDQIEERRGISQATIRGFEGTVFTGARALDLGLVDALGGEDAGISYLAEAHGLNAEMDVLDRSPDRPLDWTGARAMAVLSFGRDDGELRIDATGLRESLRDAMLLDGIMSLWHGH